MLPLSVIIFSYVIGSIPFSYLIARLASGTDLRNEGSRNVGATNVVRTAGKLPGVFALLLDLAKGYAAVEVARWLVSRPQWPFLPSPSNALSSHELWIAGAGFIAVIGHMFPLWLGFHGGKGVATSAGVFLALDPRVFAATFLVFLIVMLASRFVSLASIVSAAAAPLLFRFLADGTPFWRIVFSILISVAVIARHHSNIARLSTGKERRMGERKSE